MSTRWVRQTRIYPWAHCYLCGTAWGQPNEQRQCSVCICPVCGTRMCVSYGLKDGICPLCHYGLLTEWTEPRECSVAECHERAIALDPRHSSRYLCAHHWREHGGDALVAEAREWRNEHWREVEEG